MSIRQPKPKQIRLPFSVPRPKKGAEPPAKVCGICRSADSRYTCPRCNVPYCSLTCFREPAHAQCSEPFYKSTVMDQIAADPQAGLEDKREMMNMLRRFEEAAAEGDDAAAELLDDDDQLAAALEGIDLDNIDSNELLRLLPQSHRDAFLMSLRDPESHAARELLDTAIAAGEGEEVADDTPSLLPWWEGDALDESGESAHAPPPDDILDVIADIHPPDGMGMKLVYNIIALSVAYVHILLSHRLPSLSFASDAKEVRSDFLSLLPFLQPRSTVVYDSVSSAWGAVWDAAGSDGPLPPQALIRVLEVVGDMLHPPITLEPPNIVLLLSDVYSLFSTKLTVGKKIAFYRAAIAQISRSQWLALENVVANSVEKLKGEVSVQSLPERPSVQIHAGRPAPTAKIELLD